MDAKGFNAALAKRLGKEGGYVSRLIDGFASVVAEQCGQCGKVAFPGFGTFAGEKHPEEVTVDLATGRRLLLPPSIELIFTPGSRLRKSINS